MLGYRYHEKAAAEYHRDIDYYRQISPELGRAFVMQVEAALARIREFPHAYPCVGDAIRRCPVRRYRHAIIYEIQGEIVFVWAVMHTSREPGYWKERLKEQS